MTKRRRAGGSGRGVRADGRSKRGGPFVRIPNFVFDTLAYRSLRPGPRALLSEIIRRYNGLNNGQIGLGVREACAALNMKDKDTVNGFFKELAEKGFIVRVRSGGFNMKDPSSRRASEWRITWERANDEPPTKEFMRWKVDEPRS